jgi:cysteine dioxygenase
MAVLDGTVRESLFQVSPDGRVVTPGAVRQFRQGGVAFIVDSIGWHRIEPDAGGAAVTLHLYSKPIRECRILDEDAGRVSTKRMRYHSIGGVVQAAGVG